MNYLKKLIKSTLPIIITYIISYLVIIIISIISYLLGYTNLNKIITILPYFLLITYIIIIIYLLQKYPINNKRPQKYFPYISLGITLSIFLNMLVFKISPPTKNQATIPLTLNIISSGIIGPIYEELLFRHILYNKLTTFNSKQNSLIITTIIFALIHLSLIKIAYALILGYILTKIYEQEQNISYPILIHISANITSIFLKEYNTYLFLLSLLNLLLALKLTLKQPKLTQN